MPPPSGNVTHHAIVHARRPAAIVAAPFFLPFSTDRAMQRRRHAVAARAQAGVSAEGCVQTVRMQMSMRPLTAHKEASTRVIGLAYMRQPADDVIFAHPPEQPMLPSSSSAFLIAAAISQFSKRRGSSDIFFTRLALPPR